MAIESIFDQLRRDEDERLSVYPDSLGYWTIGMGVCIDARKGCGITKEESQLLTSNRVDQARYNILREWPWAMGMDPVRLGALLNMTYQMGVRGVSKFHDLLECLQAGDWIGAEAACLDSEWAKETPARAGRIAKQFFTGVWQ